MGLRQRILAKGKAVALSPQVMRVLSDDRVMKAAEGVLDARTRFRAAWNIILNGHELPAIDPALNDHLGEDEDGHAPAHGAKTNGQRGLGASNGNGALARGNVSGGESNGSNGHTSLREGRDSAKPNNGQRPPDGAGSGDFASSLKERSSLANVTGKDVFEKAFLFTAAENARKTGMYPYFRPLDLNDGPEAVIDGKRVTMFGSNNYLGLTTHPKVREAAVKAIERFGTSMTGSRLVNGSMKLHNEFEEKIANFFGKESALVFTTGYQVNIATCSALLSNKKTVAVIDRNVHASLYDGVRLGQSAGCRLVRYKHNDAESLDRALSKLEDAEGALVLTDGVFSAEGEIAHLDQLVPVVKRHGARLMVDDAHALGVIAPGGAGPPTVLVSRTMST